MSLKSELRTIFKSLTGLECYTTKIENAKTVEYPCLLLTTSYDGRSSQSNMCDIDVQDQSGSIIVIADKANQLEEFENLIINEIDGRVGNIGTFPALRILVSNSIDTYNYTTGQYEQNIDFSIINKK